MYFRAGLLGALSILASFGFLAILLGLAGNPLVSNNESRPFQYGLLVALGLIAAASAIASMRFHRRWRMSQQDHPSARLRRVEGISLTVVGGLLLVIGYLWLRFSGGFMGLHLVGFVLGGGLLASGLREMGSR